MIETLLTAWRGEPFDYRGQRIHVSPRPYTQPHPPFFYGGMSAVAVRRAARYGLPYFPPQPMPELEALYLSESARLGTPGKIERHDDLSLLFIDEDPERAWVELGPYFLREAAEYALWTREGVERRYEARVTTIDELRSQRVYEILTPEEVVARARSRRPLTGRFCIRSPGGIPIPARARLFRLFADRVLAPLAQAGPGISSRVPRSADASSRRIASRCAE